MGREYPRYPLVGVGAVVIMDGKILLIRRGAEPNRGGKWSVPGGMVEPGEDPDRAVLRELQEETGIIGRSMGLFGVYQYIERDKEGRVKYHFLLLDYLVEPIGGEPRASSDATELKFIDLREALNLDLTDTARQLIMDLVDSGLRPCGGGLIKYVNKVSQNR
ncbi:NUDIX hydrolase [Vulcanisaeta distributa]|uniref:NUDIX hydrolase n=1 Tax=Vulcanisaeta distributa TaxID=164451 RepID=UPI0006D12379|nr:NUDIX hydrolase [Vulcanisaeta distributa]